MREWDKHDRGANVNITNRDALSPPSLNMRAQSEDGIKSVEFL